MDSKLRRLQLATIETLSMFDTLCRENNLTYYLGFGTLLGAVRHHGYIPWDDDIDLCMPRSDYEKLILIGRDVIKHPFSICHYTVENYRSNSFNIRIENNRVFVIRNVGGEEKKFPSWISIFPIDGVSKGKIRRQLCKREASFFYTLLRFARSSKNGYGLSQKNHKEKIGIALNRLCNIGKLFDTRKIASLLNKCLSQYDYDTSGSVCIYTFDRYPFFYEKSWFGTPIYLTFEDGAYPVPAEYEAFLKQCYGDFMKLPPEQQQRSSHGNDIIVMESDI